MRVAYDNLYSHHRRFVNISLCGLAGCVGYAIYRVFKSKTYPKNRNKDGLPPDDEKRQDAISKTIHHVVDIDNLNVIRTNAINFILWRALCDAATKVETENKVTFADAVIKSPSKIWGAFMSSYSVTPFIIAIGLDTCLNAYLQLKTKEDSMSVWSQFKNISWMSLLSQFGHAVWDVMTLSVTQLTEWIFFFNPTIDRWLYSYVFPTFGLKWMLQFTYTDSNKYAVWPNMPVSMRHWLQFCVSPLGTFSSAFSYGFTELFLGMKLGCETFIDKHRIARYKYFQEAMNGFDFNFFNIFNMNQELIDTRYREKRASIENDNDALAKLDEFFFVLSEFSSYWMFRRIGCVNLWMYCLTSTGNSPPN